ncbi:hypothetical protein [Streptomyces lavendulocolor]|uniref:hypothetical protein n=1 Tax=Streptomyces lavendulocolor TaxID=67316 RepID=UPI003C2E1B36
MHEPTAYSAVEAPTVYQPQPLHPAAPYGQPAFPVVSAADPRRALVQVEGTGEWVIAHVPAAPPVIVPAAPDAVPRRPLSTLERGAIVVVSSVCALTLSTGGALAMAGPYLADVATLMFSTAAVLGTGALAWAVCRIAGGLSRATYDEVVPAAASAPVEVTINGTGGQGGRFGSRGGTGVRIDSLTINGGGR